MSNTPLPEVTEGAVDKVVAQDKNTEMLLEAILLELRMIRTLLAQASDDEILPEDVETEVEV